MLLSSPAEFQPTLIFLGVLTAVFFISYHFWGRLKLPQKDRCAASLQLPILCSSEGKDCSL